MSPEAPQDLFDAAAASELQSHGPLAARLRPRHLDEVVGQQHLLAADAPLRLLVEADRLSSAIFFGPPGTGKTTVARLVADASKKAFVQLSATSAGVKDIREVLDRARALLGQHGRQTILFLDEIHRFSRTQQDSLLPAVEDGTIVLIGATTENPFFSLTSPLLSRSTLFRFEPLSTEDVTLLGRRAADFEGVELDDDGLGALGELAGGDARSVLTTLEVAIAIARARQANATPVRVERADIEAGRGTRSLRFSTDEHYDVISAFIKSIRGSDPDAGLYWLARLIATGEDPRFIARRLVILASEDVGLAEPNALVLAEACASAIERVGFPEAGLCLAEAVVYLALAPKSNSVAKALWAAQDVVEREPQWSVPGQLRDSHYPGAAKLGHGLGYEYPHDDQRGWVEAVYLPDELAGQRFYLPSEHGREPEIAEKLEHRRGVDTVEHDGGKDERRP